MRVFEREKSTNAKSLKEIHLLTVNALKGNLKDNFLLEKNFKLT